MIRERLAMQIFQRMGLQAPRESHARVYVGGTREFAGVYGVVEVIDKDFLQRNLGRTTATCTNASGRTLRLRSLPRLDLSVCGAIFTEDARNRRDVDPVRAYSRAHRRDQQRPETQLEEALQPYLNLRRYITHIAVENFLSEPDGLLGGLGMNNFYLYRFEGTNQSAMIPWDQDLAFEWLESPPPGNFEANHSHGRSGPCRNFGMCISRRSLKSPRRSGLRSALVR